MKTFSVLELKSKVVSKLIEDEVSRLKGKFKSYQFTKTPVDKLKSGDEVIVSDGLMDPITGKAESELPTVIARFIRLKSGECEFEVTKILEDKGEDEVIVGDDIYLPGDNGMEYYKISKK